MTQLKSFKDFHIKTETKGLEGDKIKISKLFDREITVERFRLEPSKYPGKGNSDKCLWMQILLNGNRHVVFTGSSVLTEKIKQIPDDGFPFTTTIVKNPQTEHFDFT